MCAGVLFERYSQHRCFLWQRESKEEMNVPVRRFLFWLFFQSRFFFGKAMISNMTNPSQPINLSDTTPTNGSGFEFPMSPTEPGKFDFYRVHLNNQSGRKDSMFSDHCETPSLSAEMKYADKRWTPFAHLRDFSEPTRSSAPISSSTSHIPAMRSATDSDLATSTANKLSTKPIQTVASFSSLTEAVKTAMQKGSLSAGSNALRRPASGTNISSKDLNHLSPQSM